jgi:hypothetical protein
VRWIWKTPSPAGVMVGCTASPPEREMATI